MSTLKQAMDFVQLDRLVRAVKQAAPEHPLAVLMDRLKAAEAGGKGALTFPDNHKAAMRVPKGGSSCKNCEYVDADKHECKSEHYIKWNGGDPALPADLELDEICSDWFEPAEKLE